MEILSIKVNRPFKYLWLKNVVGVDLSKHCARCLSGKYDNRINSNLKHSNNIALHDGIYYLCGVSSPYRWSDNFHIAFMNARDDTTGNVIDISRNGIDLTLSGVVILPISDKYIPLVGDKNANTPAFSTCRNWQFANFLEYSHLLDII